VIWLQAERLYCLEWGILEIQKAFTRVGGELEIPKDLVLNWIEDPCWNIPSIMHAGENAAKLLSQTIEEMLLLFRTMIAKGVTKILSISLAFTFQERIVRLSSFGYIENQVKWWNPVFH